MQGFSTLSKFLFTIIFSKDVLPTTKLFIVACENSFEPSIISRLFWKRMGSILSGGLLEAASSKDSRVTILMGEC